MQKRIMQTGYKIVLFFCCIVCISYLHLNLTDGFVGGACTYPLPGVGVKVGSGCFVGSGVSATRVGVAGNRYPADQYPFTTQTSSFGQSAKKVATGPICTPFSDSYALISVCGQSLQSLPL